MTCYGLNPKLFTNGWALETKKKTKTNKEKREQPQQRLFSFTIRIRAIYQFLPPLGCKNKKNKKNQKNIKKMLDF